uniref:Uncharacterized protein n=1 Tax=viral metagenome TaxID=1070528 RepID=A0A6C0C6H0_9ZZZZ
MKNISLTDDVVVIYQKMSNTDDLIKKGKERIIKTAQEYVEKQIAQPFLKDETRIMMTELYDSLDEINARNTMIIVETAALKDKNVLSESDVNEIKNCVRFSKITIPICIIVIFATYLFMEATQWLISVWLLLGITIVWCVIFIVHYSTILNQGHWNIGYNILTGQRF